MVVEDGARGGAEGVCLGVGGVAGQPTRILFPRTGCFVDVDDTGQPSANLLDTHIFKASMHRMLRLIALSATSRLDLVFAMD